MSNETGKTPWTPGPWNLHLYPDGAFRVEVPDPHFGSLTICERRALLLPKGSEANAHLLAAAPALYEALKAAQPLLAYLAGAHAPDADLDAALGPKMPAIYAAVRTALSAARPETPTPEGEGGE